MKIKLVVPPIGDITSPYLSIACLDAFLKKQGLDAEQYDMNLEVFDYIFSKEYLSLCLEEMKAKNKKSSKLEMVQYLVDNIEECKNTLRSEAGLDKNVSMSCYDLLKVAQGVVNNLWKSESLLYKDYINENYSTYNSVTVAKCIEDVFSGKCKSRLCDIMNKFVDDLVKDAQIIGISVPFLAQVFPAFMLATLCKIAKPEIKIVMGGSLVTTWTKNLDVIRPMFRVVDYFSFFEGERSIEGLMRHLMNDTPIQNVPSLCYLKDDQIVLNPSVEPLSMDELPTPVFKKIYLSRYFSPKPILPLLTCKGCYWNRCSFCAHGVVYKDCFRTRNPRMVVDDIETCVREYGVRYFSFNDEAITVPMLKRISQEIVDRKLDIVWRDYARFDKGMSKEALELAHKSGLRQLYFGLESYNERVLATMNKGIKKENVLPIIKNCHDVGIWILVFFIVGFPTETYEEFQESCDFIKNNYNYIHNFAFSPFTAVRFSDVYNNPDKYGMKLLDIDEEDLNPSSCIVKEKSSNGNTTFGNRKKLANINGAIGSRFFRQWGGRNALIYVDQILECCKRVVLGDEALPYAVYPLFSKTGEIKYAYIEKNNKRKLVKVNKTYEPYLATLGKYDFKEDAINELSKVTGLPTELTEIISNQMITGLFGE